MPGRRLWHSGMPRRGGRLRVPSRKQAGTQRVGNKARGIAQTQGMSPLGKEGSDACAAQALPDNASVYASDAASSLGAQAGKVLGMAPACPRHLPECSAT